MNRLEQDAVKWVRERKNNQGGTTMRNIGKQKACRYLKELVRQRRAQILAQVREEAETTIMTPLHPRWNEFASGLAMAVRAEKCDSASLRLAERILGGMVGIDVGKSLAFFESQGGYCDCELLLNVG
jgi:regulator of protease activity HflC (stomatin/prohibitin superfamily)